MPSIGIRELKSQTSEILRRVQDGEEFVVTRRGKPCARLTAAPVGARRDRPTLHPILPDLPEATWEDFQEAKRIWQRIDDPKPPDA